MDGRPGAGMSGSKTGKRRRKRRERGGKKERVERWWKGGGKKGKGSETKEKKEAEREEKREGKEETGGAREEEREKTPKAAGKAEISGQPSKAGPAAMGKPPPHPSRPDRRRNPPSAPLTHGSPDRSHRESETSSKGKGLLRWRRTRQFPRAGGRWP